MYNNIPIKSKAYNNNNNNNVSKIKDNKNDIIKINGKIYNCTRSRTRNDERPTT